MDLREAAKALLAQYDQMGAYQEIGNLSPEFDALRAALAANEVSAWQPIETAPKDGTFILVRGPSGYVGTSFRYAACRWVKDYRDAWTDHANDHFTEGGSEPTHWIPLTLSSAIAADEVSAKDAEKMYEWCDSMRRYGNENKGEAMLAIVAEMQAFSLKRAAIAAHEKEPR